MMDSFRDKGTLFSEKSHSTSRFSSFLAFDKDDDDARTIKSQKTVVKTVHPNLETATVDARQKSVPNLNLDTLKKTFETMGVPVAKNLLT